MIYLTFNGQGKITGAFRQALHPSHASAYIEVTEEQAAARFQFVVQAGALVPAPAGTYDPPAPTAQELTEAARLAAFETAISADTVLSTLKGLSNAAFDQWFDDNITTLAQARVALRRVAKLALRRLL